VIIKKHHTLTALLHYRVKYNFLKIILCLPKRLFPVIVSFSYMCISQGRVATQLRYGGIFNNHIIANCPQSAPVKEFFKSVNIWRKYGQKLVGTLLRSM